MSLTRKQPFHPNTRGMEAIADLLYKELKDYDVVLKAQNSQVAS
jgi:hypothetical protein